MINGTTDTARGVTALRTWASPRERASLTTVGANPTCATYTPPSNARCFEREGAAFVEVVKSAHGGTVRAANQSRKPSL